MATLFFVIMVALAMVMLATAGRNRGNRRNGSRFPDWFFEAM